jgi:hypothetical protein
MTRAKLMVTAGVLTCLLNGLALADCKSAVEQYNFTVGEIETHIRRYAHCLAERRGQEDCSSAFRRLHTAQSNFELVVSKLQDHCPPAQRF